MSPFLLWVEIAGLLTAGAAVTVLLVRVSEARPKAASWKIPERIDARLAEILQPREVVLPVEPEEAQVVYPWREESAIKDSSGAEAGEGAHPAEERDAAYSHEKQYR